MAMQLLLIALMAVEPITASTDFNGAWVIDLASMEEPSAPQTLSLERGYFSRGDDKPDFTVKADGKFHALQSGSYVDAVAVIRLSAQEVRELDRYKGKIVYTIVYKASRSGDTLIRDVTDFSTPDGKPIRTTITYRRIGSRAPQESSLTGRWRTVTVKTPDENLTQRIEVIGNRIRSTSAGGSGYDAIAGGPPVPVKGDAETARVSVVVPNARTIVGFGSLRGEATIETMMELSPEGRTIKVTNKQLKDGTVSSWTMNRK